MSDTAVMQSERVGASSGRQLALLFAGCGSERRLAGLFTQKGSYVRLPKGRPLQFGGPSDGKVYYVVKGHVLLHLSSSAGKQLAIDIAKPGDLIGFGALREESFHSFDATTLTACEFKALSAEVLRRELSRSIDLCLETLALTQKTIARLALQLEEFALSKAAGRVVRMIIRLFEVQGVPLRNGAKASIPNQKLIAQMVGANRETVNKQLNLLRKNNIVHLSPARGASAARYPSEVKITIVDSRKLRMRTEAGVGRRREDVPRLSQHRLWSCPRP
jgi:CRP-like cAMP-binding protein